MHPSCIAPKSRGHHRSSLPRSLLRGDLVLLVLLLVKKIITEDRICDLIEFDDLDSSEKTIAIIR